jgi:hypothetical protein
MEVVRHDQIDRQVPPFVFSRHFEELLLSLIPQLALPESQTILGHHWDATCHLGVLPDDVRRRVASHNPVVQGVGSIRLKASSQAAEHSTSDARVVPEESISQAGKSKGDGSLRVPLGELQIRAFEVQERLLVLTHAVDTLVAVLGLEAHRQVVVCRAEARLPLARLNAEGAALGVEDVQAVTGEFLEQNLSGLGVGDRDLASAADVCLDLSIDDGRGAGLDVDGRLGGLSRRLGESPGLVLQLGQTGGPDTESIVTPGLDVEELRVEAEGETAAVLVGEGGVRPGAVFLVALLRRHSCVGMRCRGRLSEAKKESRAPVLFVLSSLLLPYPSKRPI